MREAISNADKEIKHWEAYKAAGSTLTKIEEADRNISDYQKERTRALEEQKTAKAMITLCDSLSADRNPASGSEFAFATGFVMSAAHCIHQDDFLEPFVVFGLIASKNLKSKLVKPSWAGGQAYQEMDGLGTVEHCAEGRLKRVVLDFGESASASPADLLTPSGAPSPPIHALNEFGYDLAIVETDCRRTMFAADFDALKGNSGGPLLRVSNGRASDEVVGIFVEGSDRGSQPIDGKFVLANKDCYLVR
ncbi:hypothetical protein CERZMDRAFT_95732 [Cercospora zeae-maydis SCOH1-5]|uniref:Serine protease n=1 Tax=Cercospora zeae-maydis SCOH1-5 TaxID=717836 RepID=A0A6A6FLZ3_9PEZI|nr:hypothetical protein CERZMDRAFT_95732 [Cercospora zeae-maydis SCOH1-5]